MLSARQPVYQRMYLYTVLCFLSRYNYRINVTLCSTLTG
ncbi:hypothetical protein [Morganella morganii IS15]|nr:hypothetical protein [Morganella morganii IS15]